MNETIQVGPYKGYLGSAEFDDDEKFFHGTVTNIRDVVTFVGDTAEDAEREFRASVDDYLEFCASRGEQPNQPAALPTLLDCCGILKTDKDSVETVREMRDEW